ncbi:major facilitator transporter (plasmid) [Ketogulonicigenium vulgare Y25]|uniref:Putative transport protein transmembrane n=1 Tax=Ketogulonicigenium vulgare (strain WSH-001) TaxID=759362 RepID=F9YBU2_KETVW|nr:MFS transporter [Ketogulonicigenium vulgare]ADO44410.1 major facilitator transporter [Ketogulonicigenium vulgare Y25]AEM42844.1 putative transport protein transmembrane [Ketogulonicigenium vulgare WSH-001]ALJ82728.1 MFS transporter [Ketogulonicigenium vulgare]
MPAIFAGMSGKAAIPYLIAGVLIALAQGLGQGFITANLPQIAGDLGVSTTDATWLMVAYMTPRAALPLLLIKIRTQYGLRRFTEVSVIAFALVAVAALFTDDMDSAMLVQFLSGCAAAPLSTLAFLYMIEPFSPMFKLKLGMPLAMTMIMIGPNFARVVSPSLIGDGGLFGIHLASLGLALMCLAVVWFLPLQPQPREKVLKTLDFVSFALISAGFTGLISCATLGPTYFWDQAAWIGWVLAGSVGLLAAAVMVELTRDDPMIDFRWIASPAILHLTITLLLFRLILSEQSAGAPRMFQVLGVGPGQMVDLFSVICWATLLGGLIAIIWIKPKQEAAMHATALVLIACAAFLDSQSTIDTRPAQFMFSQALIAIGSMLFMPPAMMMGLMSALARGPQYILSFIIVFIATQSLGAVMGSGLFTTLINHRQAFHLATLNEQLVPTDPQVQAAIAAGARMFAATSADQAANQSNAVAQLATQANQQAYVLAYNDAYFIIGLIACAALAALILHSLRDWIWRKIDPSVIPAGPPGPPSGPPTPPAAAPADAPTPSRT